MNMLNVFQPSLGPEELVAVGRVFASNWVGRGRLTSEFEGAFAAYRGVPADQVRSVSCCTEGLFQAMALLGIGPGDEVVLPSLSFVGAANAIAAAGARPVFCDVDRRSLNATAATIADRISGRTRAVIVIHYGGVPCELDEIQALLAGTDIALIEDSACSVASSYRGRACGTAGDIGVWSFDAMKILVTGDGGMVFCRDAAAVERLEQSVYLGLEQSSGFARQTSERWWEFEVSGFGRRAIMNDIASAIGLEQIKKLPDFIARRQRVHECYDAAFADLDWLLTPPPLPADVTSSYYFYWVELAPGRRDRLAVHLRDAGIYTTFRYHPLHTVRAYGSTARLPAAEAAAAGTLCLPIHQSLAEADVERVIHGVRHFGRVL